MFHVAFEFPFGSLALELVFLTWVPLGHCTLDLLLIQLTNWESQVPNDLMQLDLK